ncbi:MAG: D-alanine--D-alanine ligase [Gammaproteobacteria bacterium]|nr:D-alanine--D-alanine ligase [Gammaproteobacteria bacterium]NIR85113.1 D-alanine--D-alanine ligase [Gammaproteobacteria bacterium]NIR92042.1 D-alanine--D-alanine ligase [Gammaproteobacteria bacterium]NIU06162.1 D-alanine--D-alanine ligase [Gammaproteobacteria bacterium]NIV53161.1 D-alanine--D-alanine ligase [Gammaproteobacteria bacterium]
MADKRPRVGILFGGRSAEHEVSLQSAKNVLDAIDKDKYDVVLIGIDRDGQWYLNDASRFLLESPSELKVLAQADQGVALVPGEGGAHLVRRDDQGTLGSVDVVFPVLHGPFGEDGTVQGLLRLADIPFVGAGVTGSAVGMDKDVMKRLLRDAGLPIARFVVAERHRRPPAFDQVVAQLGLPFFVKPANLGSSVGVSRVADPEAFNRALADAFDYDRKVIIEEYVEGRELECSVLGNEDPVASLPGEIIPRHAFYSYEAKYLDENGAALEIPAKLADDVLREVQRLAVEAFRVLCCEGMARVDFFLRGEHELIVNEINTIPGFTRISMYPKLWEASGIGYSELIDRLIQLALERHEGEKGLKHSYL